MNPHPSDLLLERMLSCESLPDSLLDHVQTCDVCWMRWSALHADDGQTLPVRPLASVGPAPIQPASSQTPWWIAGLVAVAALAALSIAVTPSSTQEQTTILQLKQEIATLRSELDAVRQTPQTRGAQEGTRAQDADDGAPPIHSGSRTATSPLSEAPSVSEADIPPQVLQQAVDKAIEHRKGAAFDKAQRKHVPEALMLVGTKVDALVTKGLLTDAEAGEVERLLQDEIEEGWAIKRDVTSGDLTNEEGIADWKLLRQETNDTLLEYLEPQAVKNLRDDAKE